MQLSEVKVRTIVMANDRV